MTSCEEEYLDIGEDIYYLNVQKDFFYTDSILFTKECFSKNVHGFPNIAILLIKHCFLCTPLSESCDPCDSTELLPQSVEIPSYALSMINTTLPLTDSGFHIEVPSLSDQTVSDQPLVLGQAALSSEIPSSVESQQQTASENNVNNTLMDG